MRETLPALAAERAWPVHLDHCFARILLDAACGGRWTDHVRGRPAFRSIDDAGLARALALGEAVAEGAADLHVLDAQSLAWRGKTRKKPRPFPTEASLNSSAGAA